MSCLGGAVHYFNKYDMKVTGIIHAGAGHNLEEARRPALFSIK